MRFFRRKAQAPRPDPTLLVIGLGNPGPQYARTRHNVGFEVVEHLAKLHRIKLDSHRYRAAFGVGTIGEVGVALVKPLTFMNLSSEAVSALARQFAIPPRSTLVVADDLDLPTGTIRLRAKGSSGGHNGHKSIIAALGTEEYPRLKVGIGKGDDETVAHVLSRFTPNERLVIDDAIDRAAEVCRVFLNEGLEKAMQLANTDPAK